MPIVSKRQNRFFRAHENDKGKIGKVAREFIKATPAKAFKRMPESAKPATPRADKWYGPKDD